jgi:hypothetical protein
MVKALFKPQTVIVAAATVIALVVFNLARPAPDHELQASFDAWYSAAAARVSDSAETSQTSHGISVSIKLSGSENPGEWRLPAANVPSLEERARMARILQLLSEAQVFNLPSLRSQSGQEPHLAITVADHERTFETKVSLQTVAENIQLQNLLKLLEVYSLQPAATVANPAQL